ncbi:unnamed protein product [Paramecium octaurelia]|uniref:Uncharacterized protein n=1 Tax=Paramecium octaurelia TaxID=43137 RepID=A0A8S1TAU4_PAROT|nr:unnamed protein product [Paramecium octaurelia]
MGEVVKMLFVQKGQTWKIIFVEDCVNLNQLFEIISECNIKQKKTQESQKVKRRGQLNTQFKEKKKSIDVPIQQQSPQDIYEVDKNFADKNNIDTQQQLQIQQMRLKNHQKKYYQSCITFFEIKLSNRQRELP